MTDLFTNHERFADPDAWHAAVDELRAGGPVQWVDQRYEGWPPFWAVLGHEEVMQVERQPKLFTNEPLSVLGRLQDIEAMQASGAVIRASTRRRPPSP